MEVTLLGLGIAGESGLRLLVLQRVQDLAVRNVAHLVVLLDDKTLAVAHAIDAFGHQGIASLVGGADIAIDAFPALSAVALCALAGRPISAVSERAADRIGAVVATEARRTHAAAVALAAARELVARELLKVAVEAGRTAVGTIVIDGEQVLHDIVAGVVRKDALGGGEAGESCGSGQQLGGPSGRAHDGCGGGRGPSWRVAMQLPGAGGGATLGL